MQLLRFPFRIDIDPPTLIRQTHPSIILVLDDRKQLPPRRRICVLRVHESAETSAHILERIRGEGHSDMVVLHLTCNGDRLDLRVVDAVFHLFRSRFVVLRTVHGEVLQLRVALHRLLRDPEHLRDIVEVHARKLLRPIVKFREYLVVLGPVDPD